ncbi:MAG: glycerol-3-phosphate acyltransferase [Erysipelotrichaceae bacterium]|nr:glycerol-3-phosphate acyltransferase [Erysipelotrichaceae bacterium]
MDYLYTILISYLFGSFNTAYFIGKVHGFDIRERGSHNAGASNIKVNFGWAAGIFTGLCDALKAVAAVKLCGYLFKGNEIIPFLAGAVAVIGHMYPFYMGFKGGKGYASYIGMMAALNIFPVTVAISVITIIVSALTNYIAAGTLAALLIAPAYYIYTKANPYVIAIVTGISLLIAFKHRVNVKRIINHEEIGIFERKKEKESESQG